MIGTKKQNVLLLLLAISFVFAGCASQRLTKKAAKFEAAGLYEDAAEYYLEAVKKNKGNVDAKLGLRKTGQQTLDKKLGQLKDSYRQTDFEEVVYYYKDAERYYNRLYVEGVELTFPEIYESYYDEAKNDFLNDLYIEGMDKLQREEFASAEKIFKEIKQVDPDYKDASEQYLVARVEPVYRQGNAYFENGMYRSAYYSYGEVLQHKSNYKQALTLKNEAREKGTISILVTGFGFNHQSYMHTAEIITSGVKGQLIKTNNPFLKIIDESGVRNRIYKNGKIDREAASLLGINSILSGKVLHIQKVNGKLNRENKRGYIKEWKTKTDSEGKSYKVPDYKKTEYQQYNQENSVNLRVDFSLVSTENGEVLVSDVLQLDNTDRVEYAKYNGDTKKLVPGYWSSRSSSSTRDIIKDNSRDNRSLQQLLNADRSPKNVSTLMSEVTDQSARNIVDKIDEYNPER